MTNEQLVLRIQAGENTAESMLQLYEQNRGVVYQIAKKYSGYSELEDLMQEAYLALNEAVRHYDPKGGATFIHYAVFWFDQGMMRYIEKNSNTIRIPNHMRQLIVQYKKVFNAYKLYYGREPSDKEIMSLLSVGRTKLEDIKKSLRMDDMQSLSKPVGGENEEIMLEDLVASDEDLEEDICKKLDYEIMQEALWDAVDALPERESAVVRMRYQDKMTLKETGQQLGVTTERTRVIEASAFRKLRIPSKCEKFRSYFEQYISASPIHHVTVNKFNDTWTSSTELLALKRYERMCENDTKMILEKSI